MKFLLTYDVNVGHDEVKKLLIKDGYQDYLKCDDGVCYQLPNTTLLVERGTVEEVNEEFQNACEIYNRENGYKLFKSNTRYFIAQWHSPVRMDGPIVRR